MSEIEKLKLAAISSEMTDQEVYSILLKTSISSQDDLDEILSVLNKYRKTIFEKLLNKIG